jgi:hypothetical protein
MAKKNLTRFFSNSGLHSAGMKSTLILALVFLLVIAGCGGGSSTTTAGGKTPIDPSGNWAMKFSDTSGNSFLLSALFSQTGSIVSGINISPAGNPAPFSCVPFSATFANGEVLNVDQFSGDINTQSFGNIHFSSTLNAAGTHSSGTYTLTGNCWTVSPTGTFSADEVPSVAGTWTGTVTCTSNCPAGSTTGTITATLTQNDQTGVVAGTYAISGLPGISSGNVSTGKFDVLSGLVLQVSFADNNGNTYVMAGGPGFLGPGLGLDRTFAGILNGGNIVPPAPDVARYSITMSH